jgi:hypothetical protein
MANLIESTLNNTLKGSQYGIQHYDKISKILHQICFPNLSITISLQNNKWIAIQKNCENEEIIGTLSYNSNNTWEWDNIPNIPSSKRMVFATYEYRVMNDDDFEFYCGKAPKHTLNPYLNWA